MLLIFECSSTDWDCVISVVKREGTKHMKEPGVAQVVIETHLKLINLCLYLDVSTGADRRDVLDAKCQWPAVHLEPDEQSRNDNKFGSFSAMTGELLWKKNILFQLSQSFWQLILISFFYKVIDKKTCYDIWQVFLEYKIFKKFYY